MPARACFTSAKPTRRSLAFSGAEAAEVSGRIILHQTGGKAEEPVK